MIAARAGIRKRENVLSSGHARTTPPSATTSAITVSANNGRPSGLAAIDDVICQRAMYANEVVSPQVGHGSPVNAWNAHGGKPSCVCVPNPRGSGCSQRASTRTEPVDSANAEAFSVSWIPW